MSPLFSGAAADGLPKRDTSLRLPERSIREPSASKVMSHRRDGDATFLGYWGMFPYSGQSGCPEIAAFAVSTCKKREHKCQILDQKRLMLRCPLGEQLRKVFPMNVGTQFAVSTDVMNKNSQILRPRQKLSLGDLILAVSSCTKSSRETVATVADLLGSGQVRVEDHGRFLRAKVC